MHLKRTLIFGVLTLLFATLCYAQSEVVGADSERFQEISVMGGLFINGTTHANFSGGYFVNFRDHIGLDFDVSASLLPKGTITSFTANLKFPFHNDSKKFFGYAVGGAGVTRSGVDLEDKGFALQDQGIEVDTVSWDTTVDLGAGWGIHLHEGLYWKFDYRFFMVMFNKNKDTDHYHRFVMGFGARF
ncbi:hypothetical protein ACFLU6_02525 [Acidobacteriota bacterium]